MDSECTLPVKMMKQKDELDTKDDSGILFLEIFKK